MATIADTDLAIVGAGAAGLAAARTAARVGLDFHLLEARSRVGGRCVTVASPAGCAVDLGASWIHAAGPGNPLTAEARRLGIETPPDPRRRRLFAAGRPATPAAHAAYAAVSAALMTAGAPGGDASLADLVGGDPTRLAAVKHLARAVCGVEPKEAGLADWFDCTDGEDDLVRGGYGALLKAATVKVPVTTSAPVRSIEVGPRGVSLEGAFGTLRARHVILTIPLPVLAAGGIEVRPAWPKETLAAFAALPSGVLLKAAFDLRAEPLGLSDTWYAQDAGGDGPFFLVRPLGEDSAYAFFGGERARTLEAEGERAVFAAAEAGFVAMLGVEARGVLRPAATHLWGRDPLALGSYSVARPGGLWARSALRAPIFERLWLAGEATAHGGRQATVAGAWQAGEAAAARVVSRFEI